MDYKQRMVKEFRELATRMDKLAQIIVRYERGELDFEPKCSIELLRTQYSIMCAYSDVLAERARIEDIGLYGWVDGEKEADDDNESEE